MIAWYAYEQQLVPPKSFENIHAIAMFKLFCWFPVVWTVSDNGHGPATEDEKVIIFQIKIYQLKKLHTICPHLLVVSKMEKMHWPATRRSSNMKIIHF